MTEIRIGTSGYHYKHWIGRYYPADIRPAGMLAHYLRDFDTVELNNTFYHLPTEAAFDGWKKAVPHDFLVAVDAAQAAAPSNDFLINGALRAEFQRIGVLRAPGFFCRDFEPAVLQ